MTKLNKPPLLLPLGSGHLNHWTNTLLRCHLVRTLLFGSVVLLSPSSILYASGLYEGDRNSFGRFHGEGTYTNSRGDTYVGHWRDGVKSGEGTLTKANGETYQGNWQENKRNGLGVQTYKNGDIYKGQWIYNKKRGHGKYIYSNGNVYEGNFESNKYHQKGTLSYANGDKLEGKWTEGTPPSIGRFIFRSGLTYEGPISALKPHGKGLCSNPSKNLARPQKTSTCHFNLGQEIVSMTPPKKTIAKLKHPTKQTKLNIKAGNSHEKKAALGSSSKTPEVKRKNINPVMVAVKKPRPTPSEATAAPVEKKKKNPLYKGNKPEFAFKHNWKGALTLAQSSKTWQEQPDKYKDHLHIKSEGNDFSISIRIQDYDGPGTYSLGYYDVRVDNSSNTAYASNQKFPGKIQITQDNTHFLSGTFSLDLYPNGNSDLKNKIELRSGFFTIAKKTP